ncbi:hypothetical protein ACLKA7_001497 [Drosophila subpalustris]
MAIDLRNRGPYTPAPVSPFSSFEPSVYHTCAPDESKDKSHPALVICTGRYSPSHFVKMEQLIREASVHADCYGGSHRDRRNIASTYTPWKVSV